MKVLGVSAMFENHKIYEQQSTRLTRDEEIQKQKQKQKQKRKGAYRVTQREDTTTE
jgi:hypothetical protein